MDDAYFIHNHHSRRAMCLGMLPRGTLATYSTPLQHSVTYFVVHNIYSFTLKSITPDDIYCTRLLRISKMFNATRRCTNPPHPAYTMSLNSISRAKQRSLGA